jgi:hypothetical protein
MAAMSADTAPAAMPSEEKLAAIIQNGIAEHCSIDAVEMEIDGTGPASYNAAHRILALFAPILAEKERAELLMINQSQVFKRERDLERRRALAAEAALAAERERCAKIAEELGPTLDGESSWYASNQIAAAIRAQGDQHD